MSVTTWVVWGVGVAVGGLTVSWALRKYHQPVWMPPILLGLGLWLLPFLGLESQRGWAEDGLKVILWSGLAALALTDWFSLRLPDRILFPLIPVAGLLAPVDGLAGALCASLMCLLIQWVHPGKMGWGDVKLAFLMGLAFGLTAWPFIVLVALVLGCCAHMRLRVAKVPFGPPLIMGAWVYAITEGAGAGCIGTI